MKNINPDSAIKLADLMYDLAVEKDYKDMQALAFKTKGISYYFLRQYDSVLIMYNRGIEIAKNAGLRKELANLYNNRGITYNRLGDPVSALESHFNSLEIRMEQGDENLVAFSYSNIGVVYRTQEDFSRALEYFQKSLMISEKISDKDRLASAYQNVGLIYLEIGDNEKAKDYLQKSLVIFLELGNPYRTTFAYNNLGIVYKNNGDYTAARDVYQKGLELSKKSNIKGNIPDLYRNIGNTYRLEKEYDLALTYYHKSLQLYSDYDNKHGVAASYSDIGVIHNKLEEFDQGRIWCEKAYNMGSELDNAQLEDIQNSCDCLHNSYKGLGNMAKAFEFLVKYYEARDSLDIRKNSQEITRLSLKYEFEKQRLSDSLAMEEARLKAELAYLDNLGKEKVQRNTFMYIGIGILLLAGGLFSRLRFVRKTNQTLKEKNKLIEREKKRAEESERTKEQFFANISHEFRTPLTLILGPLEKLLINTTDKKAEHDLLIMKRNATRLQSMINELMNLYKLESGKIKLQSMEKDIVSFLTTYIQSFESLAKQQHIKLSVKSEFRSIPIFYDQEKIEKVITNLLSNAFDAVQSIIAVEFAVEFA